LNPELSPFIRVVLRKRVDMQLGIFAKTFMRPTVEEVFQAVARHGVHCVQFNFASAGVPSLPAEIDPLLATRIRKAASERRVAIAAISGTFNMIHPDVGERREGLRRLNVIAGACAEIGANLVTVCTGTRDPANMWRFHPENGSIGAWRDLLATMKKALTIAAKHDITLALEPETANVVSSARKARRLLDELKSPRLKIIMDAANLFRPGDLARMDEILEEAFDLLGPDIILAHAKELALDGHPSGLALGSGALDWDRIMALLHRVHFTGPLVMHGFEECDVAASVKFLRAKLGPVSPR
jgi:sugar phosphate isomerase/epimerase